MTPAAKSTTGCWATHGIPLHVGNFRFVFLWPPPPLGGSAQYYRQIRQQQNLNRLFRCCPIDGSQLLLQWATRGSWSSFGKVF